MTPGEKQERLYALLGSVLESSLSDFYRALYAARGYTLPERHGFALEEVPIISWDDIERHPYLERLYTQEKQYVKAVYASDDRAMLIARTLPDVEAEAVPYEGERPLVLFESGHETVEKSLWLYAQNILPLIGEKNLEVTAMNAERYTIDGIVGDTESALALVPHLRKRGGTEGIAHIYIVDRRFDFEGVRAGYPNAYLAFFLALPETGRFAFACPERAGLFHPDEASIVELEHGELVVSRLIELPTPIVRYRTGLSARGESASCACGAELSFTLA